MRLTYKMRNTPASRLQVTPLLMIFVITVYFINSLSNRLQASASTLGLNDVANAIGWLLLVVTILTVHRVTLIFANLADRIPRRLQTVIIVIVGVTATHLLVFPRAGIEVAVAAIVLAAILSTLVRVNNPIAALVFRALALVGIAVLVIRLIRLEVHH